MGQRRTSEDSQAAARRAGTARPRLGAVVGADGRTLPLTERILRWLPGPRAPWVVLWVLVPWLNLAVAAASGAWAPAGIPRTEVLNRAAVSVAILLSLWGAARLADRLRRLQPQLAGVIRGEEPDVARLFRGVGSVAGPLVLVGVQAAILPLDEALRGEPGAALLQAATWLVGGIAPCTVLWVYVALQLGLNRLGLGRLTLQPYQGDRSLGLEPVGNLAFTGLWMFLGAGGPLVLTGASDVPAAVVSGCVLLGGVALFFFSLRNLHRQMAAVKARELSRARSLYRRAYQQLEAQPTLEVLQQQAGALAAAEALEKRAERIQEWPFDEGTFARVVTIASSVAGVIIARLILAPAGL